MILNYIKLILASTVTACVSIPAASTLDRIPVGIASFAVGLKICPITTGIKLYKSIIMKKET